MRPPRYSVELVSQGRSMGSIGVYRFRSFAHLIARRNHEDAVRLGQTNLGRWCVIDLESDPANPSFGCPDRTPPHGRSGGTE